MFICNNKFFCTYDIRRAILGRLKGGGGGRMTKICPFSSRVLLCLSCPMGLHLLDLGDLYFSS